MNPDKLWLSVLTGSACLALTAGLAAGQPKPISACGTTIGAPGSYIVTHNLTATSTSLPCINVTASGVTIDLGGFVLTGIGGSPGIAAGAGPLTISNGVIRSFLLAISAGVPGVKLRDVTSVSNQTAGAALEDTAEVTDSAFFSNSANGLNVVSDALVADSTFVGNGGSGLFAGGEGGVVTENVASDDGVAFNNPGFITAGNATVTGNAANGNSFAGFLDRVGGDSFESDTATGTTIVGEGFDTGEQSNFGEILGDSTFIGNSAASNKFDGFFDAGGSTFLANTADGNGGVGFFSPEALGGTFVTNTADSNNFGFNMLCPSNLVGNSALLNTTTQFAATGGSGCNVQINLGF